MMWAQFNGAQRYGLQHAAVIKAASVQTAKQIINPRYLKAQGEIKRRPRTSKRPDDAPPPLKRANTPQSLQRATPVAT